ncbi:sigma-70 family RNA polymerase sigma factor [Martelella mediterranea]|uniref:RNA polymerase sigma factor n=1 Tax=Martelella mediterranea DSM 17316 TaxID=1122214 RepID=A0A1U9Z7Y3_9HYPH|nr:sigma-70 family RNA polymerase sigma factor [Martelella mediterranea]AQZ53740.1 putative RNA polymerase sigma-C factor [Martelella mediterranea DSM 17316]
MNQHEVRLRSRQRQDIVDLIPALRAFARTFCRNPNDADDLVQETMLKGIANLDKFTPGTRLKSWLFTIMRNTFYTQIKVRNREAPGEKDCVASLPQNDATQDWSVRGQELLDALSRIPPHYREMFVLVMVLGESYSDAAEICDCAIGTVKSRVNRARQLLLEELGELQ